MSPYLLLALQALLIAIASFLGGWVPTRWHLSQARMEFAIAFIAGLMVGLGVMDLVPHAIETRLLAQSGVDTFTALTPLWAWVLAGIITMFVVERVFCSHDHSGIGEAVTLHVDEDGHQHREHGHSLTWTGVFFGMTVHSLLGGVALGASVLAVAGGDTVGLTAGIGTFLLILLHKPFDAMSVTMLLPERTRRARLGVAINVAFALITPLGAGLCAMGLLGQDVIDRSVLISNAIAFSAGMFICIALADLLPELTFHQRGKLRYMLVFGLALGLLLAWGITRLHEVGHQHDHGDAEHADHDHALRVVEPNSGGAVDPWVRADILQITMFNATIIIPNSS